MDVVDKIQQFIKYWYIRYLLATELYMVETWEKITVHIFIALLFGLFWYLNYSIVTNVITQLRNTSHVEQIS